MDVICEFVHVFDVILIEGFSNWQISGKNLKHIVKHLQLVALVYNMPSESSSIFEPQYSFFFCCPVSIMLCVFDRDNDDSLVFEVYLLPVRWKKILCLER